MLGADLEAHIVKPGLVTVPTTGLVSPAEALGPDALRRATEPDEFSAAVSAKVVGPQTDASGCWLAGQTVCASIAALTRPE